MGRRASDRGRARSELTPERNEVRLGLLYTVTFTTLEAWSVEVTADAGIEGRGFLVVEGGPHQAPLGPLSAVIVWVLVSLGFSSGKGGA